MLIRTMERCLSHVFPSAGPLMQVELFGKSYGNPLWTLDSMRCRSCRAWCTFQEDGDVKVMLSALWATETGGKYMEQGSCDRFTFQKLWSFVHSVFWTRNREELILLTGVKRTDTAEKTEPVRYEKKGETRDRPCSAARRLPHQCAWRLSVTVG